MLFKAVKCEYGCMRRYAIKSECGGLSDLPRRPAVMIPPKEVGYQTQTRTLEVQHALSHVGNRT